MSADHPKADVDRWRDLVTALDKSIKDQPMATLAVAAIAGFVLGAIWKT